MMLNLAAMISRSGETGKLNEVRGLFVLSVVAIMLRARNGYGYKEFFGYLVGPMAKSAFLFNSVWLAAVDIVRNCDCKHILGPLPTGREALVAMRNASAGKA